MGEFFYDGTTISPFEVVFVAMNTLVVENNWSFARQAAIYQAWLQLQVRSSAFHPVPAMVLALTLLVLSSTALTVSLLSPQYQYLSSQGQCVHHTYNLFSLPD